MGEGYNKIVGTMLVPTGGHLSSARDGSNYGGVLSDKNNQVIGQARFIPNSTVADGHEDKGVLGKVLLGVGVAVIGIFAYKKFHKSRKIKRLEDKCSSERDTQRHDAAAAETTSVPVVSELELTNEQKQEITLFVLYLADAQCHLNNLVTQGLDASAVRPYIARMISTLAKCYPKELADQVNRLIERQHRETQNLVMPPRLSTCCRHHAPAGHDAGHRTCAQHLGTCRTQRAAPLSPCLVRVTPAQPVRGRAAAVGIQGSHQ